MYSKMDPDFEQYVQTSFQGGNDPVGFELDSNLESKGGYKKKGRGSRGRGRGRGRGGGLSLQRNQSKDSLKFSQSGCAYSLQIKKELADGYFNFENIESSSIDDYRQHAQELSSYSNSVEGSAGDQS